ncbi:MAG: hypothetical protein RLZZ337_1524 [Bacteroidota bacterium]|jgi:hypothetical protein
MSFFEEYQEFTTSSEVGSDLNRLKYRYKNIIESVSYKNKTVLDLGSHDGRWSFAALEAGAKSTLGVEYNESLILKANSIKKKYRWVNADFIKEDNISFLKNNNFKYDVILCCGVFYHTLKHLEYFKYMCESFNDCIILDTHIWPSQDPMVHIQLESSTWDGNGYRNIDKDIDVNGSPKNILTGIPSESYINTLAEGFGLSIEKLDYTKEIKNQHKLVDYVMKQRYVYILKKIH